MTEQELVYRGVRTLIGAERHGTRRWTIHLEGVPASGTATADATGRGSFKAAVFAARHAVDAWLDDADRSAPTLRPGPCPGPDSL